MRVKGKVHKVVVRQTLMYRLEAAPLKKMVVATKRDQIRNENIRETVKVVEVFKSIQES